MKKLAFILSVLVSSVTFAQELIYQATYNKQVTIDIEDGKLTEDERTIDVEETTYTIYKSENGAYYIEVVTEGVLYTFDLMDLYYTEDGDVFGYNFDDELLYNGS